MNVMSKALLPVLLFCLAGTAFAQELHNPMRATPNPLWPNLTSPEPVSEAEPNPMFGNLPEGEGMEDTYYQCVACHSTGIIIQQSLSDARWEYLWDWMVEEQGMYDPEDGLREEILAYLTTHFSSER